MAILRTFVEDEQGADGIEYGIIVALIFLVILVAVANLASSTTAMWTNVSSHVK
jgi:pilus assembly protein Flp/PilA